MSECVAEATPCGLCRPEPHVVVAVGALWSLCLNENQATPGRVYFALARHETDVTALSVDEQHALWRGLRQVKQALQDALAPDHFNYAFLMNVDPHVHMHVYPRYKADRDWGMEKWQDLAFGGHYDPQAVHALTPSFADHLRGVLQLHLDGDGGPAF